MSLLDAVIADLEQHEGFRQFPYRDTVGILTIGYGRNLEAVGISRDEAKTMLGNDVAWALAGLQKAIPWWLNLDDVRKGVLLNMAVNLGVSGLLKFNQTLAAIEQGNYEAASRLMLRSKWAKQVKGRATELAERMRSSKVLGGGPHDLS